MRRGRPRCADRPDDTRRLEPAAILTGFVRNEPCGGHDNHVFHRAPGERATAGMRVRQHRDLACHGEMGSQRADLGNATLAGMAGSVKVDAPMRQTPLRCATQHCLRRMAARTWSRRRGGQDGNVIGPDLHTGESRFPSLL
ncbi:hypothetical protein [Candidatus Chloroploca sp. Khr17]|uniref:hypothetical protein n=1 Tax=Candidatus Chloroploca sp. Khr17 TaxID=2496869 RepID=UPI00101C5AFC|nr:hypothetical protein [Candidatus Chloroploca sp. Khr17]